MSKYRPKDEFGWKQLFHDWLYQFHKKYLAIEKGNTRLQQELFIVKHNQFEEMINPDIPGQMTKAIMDSYQNLTASYYALHQLNNVNVGMSTSPREHVRKLRTRGDLGKKVAQPPTHSKGRAQHKDEKETSLEDNFQNIERIDYREDNTNVLLQIMKYFGKDVNIYEMYQLFRTIVAKGEGRDEVLFQDNLKENPVERYTFDSDGVVRDMFIAALSELKYMGYLSQTRQSQFIFRKNYFGKPKVYKNIVKSDE